MAGALAAGLCAVEALPPPCLLEPAVPLLLEGACRRCPPPPPGLPRPPASAPCLEDSDGFADLAVELVGRRELFSACPLASLAAALVVLQYSASTRPFEVGEWLGMMADSASRAWPRGFDLHPFPFWSERRSLSAQFSFHAKYFAAHLWSCLEDEAEAARGSYTLRAGHDKEEVHCIARPSDYQMVMRCREQRKAQPQPGVRGLVADARGAAAPPRRAPRGAGGAAAVRCPDEAARAAWAAERRLASAGSAEGGARARAADEAASAARRKYAGRSAGDSERPGLGCDDPEAEWRVDFRHYHKCILVTVLERLRFPPGAVVLDWGSGCGHKLSWAANLYGLDGLGVDIVGDSVRWATEHSLGSYCEVDGRFVSWLPDDYFDGTLSYAALMHLDPADQCAVVTELVGKVRIGGKMWFGWNAPEIWQNNSELEARWMLPAKDAWGACFDQALQADPRWASGEIAIAWETVEEQYLFPDDKEAIGIYLYLPPAYSLFITRVPGGRGGQAGADRGEL